MFTDKEELNWIESSQAYGASAEKTQTKGEYKLHLVAQPQMNVILKMVNGRPRAVTTLKERTVFLSDIYVDSSDSWIGLPTVNFVDATGVTADDKAETIVQRLKG